MILSELIHDLNFKLVNGGENVDIAHIEYDSKLVKPGEAFSCVVGTFKDGHDFAEEAVKNGASALIVERELPFPVPQVIVPNSRRAMAILAEKLCGKKDFTGKKRNTFTRYLVIKKKTSWQLMDKYILFDSFNKCIGRRARPLGAKRSYLSLGNIFICSSSERAHTKAQWYLQIMNAIRANLTSCHTLQHNNEDSLHRIFVYSSDSSYALICNKTLTSAIDFIDQFFIRHNSCNDNLHEQHVWRAIQNSLRIESEVYSDNSFDIYAVMTDKTIVPAEGFQIRLLLNKLIIELLISRIQNKLMKDKFIQICYVTPFYGLKEKSSFAWPRYRNTSASFA